MPMLAPDAPHRAPVGFHQTTERKELENEIEDFKRAFTDQASTVCLITGTHALPGPVLSASGASRAASWYTIARGFFPRSREMTADERAELDAVRRNIYRNTGEAGGKLDSI